MNRKYGYFFAGIIQAMITITANPVLGLWSVPLGVLIGFLIMMLSDIYLD